MVRKSGVINIASLSSPLVRWSAFLEHCYSTLIGSHSIAQLATSAISSSADIDAASRYYHCLVRYVVPSSYDYEHKSTA